MSRRLWAITAFLLAAFCMIQNPWHTNQVLARGLSQSTPWTDPVLIAENASAPVITGDSSGMLHTFYVEGWYDAEAGPAGQAIMYQRGDGAGWSTATDVLISPNKTVITLDGIVIDRDGFLHLLWNDFQALYLSTAHVSTADDPRSWQTSTLLTGQLPIADIVQDDTGKLHVLVRSDLFSVSYLSLDDKDSVWSSPALIETVAQPEEYAIGGVQLALASSETIHVTWFQTAAQVNWNFWSVWYARSDDGGQTWTRKDEIATPRFGASDIAVDSNGNIHLVYGRNIGSPDGRWYQWSQDNGETWSHPAPLFPSFEYASGDTGGYGFALDSAGILHMVNSFGDKSGEATAYHLEWQGVSWSPPQLLMEKHPHFPRLVTTLGNHLNFVAMAGPEHKLWYRSSVVNAPGQEPIAVPQEFEKGIANQEIGMAEATVSVPIPTGETTPREPIVPAAIDPQAPRSQTSSVMPILFGVLPALLLVVVSFIFARLAKMGHRS